MKDFEKLNELVIEWAKEKGILEKATSLTQMKKTIEEVEETRDALFAKQNNLETFINSKGQVKNTKEEIKDGFGDILVTILIGCEMQKLNPLDCLETAYNVISKRKGVMKDGIFVKEDENQISILDVEGVK